MNTYLNMHITSKMLALIAMLCFVAVSCGDDPASADEEPPEFPDFQQNMPDISFFQENNPEKANTNLSTENFNRASLYALSLSSVAFMGQLYSSLFTADREDADYVDGSWVWEYGYSSQGKSASIELTATESGDYINWSMDWTINDGEQEIEDARVFEGTVAQDGSSGNWTFYDMNEDNIGEPVLVTEWNSTNDDVREIDTKLYEDGVLLNTFAYEQDRPEFSLSLTGEDFENDIYIFWNEDTNEGYYQLGPEDRNCWDRDFQDVECS